MHIIPKEQFVKIINNIQREQERIINFNNALDKVVNGFPVVTLGEGYLYSLLDVLNYIFNDTSLYPTIDWWLFEKVEKKIWLAPHCSINNTDKELEVDVSSPECYATFLLHRLNIINFVFCKLFVVRFFHNQYIFNSHLEGLK